MARRSSAQLIHASAGSAAPLIHASTGPAAQLVQARAGTSSAPSPSTGGISGGRASGNGNRAVAGRNGVAKLFRGGNAKNPKWELRDAAGNILKKYSAQEATNVMKRGAVGATMDPMDQQAYWRATGGETEAEKEDRLTQQGVQGKRAEVIFKHQMDAAEQQRREQAKAAEFDRQQAILQKNALERQKLVNDGKVSVVKERQAGIDAGNEAFNERYGIDAGTKLTKREMDLISTGKMRWGYDPKQESEIKQMESDAESGRINGTLSDEDFGKAMDEISNRRSKLRKGMQKNTDERTAEEILNGAVKGPDGNFYYKDDAGKLQRIGREEADKRDVNAERIAAERRKRIEKRTREIIDNSLDFENPPTQAEARAQAISEENINQSVDEANGELYTQGKADDTGSAPTSNLERDALGVGLPYYRDALGGTENTDQLPNNGNGAQDVPVNGEPGKREWYEPEVSDGYKTDNVVLTLEDGRQCMPISDANGNVVGAVNQDGTTMVFDGGNGKPRILNPGEKAPWSPSGDDADAAGKPVVENNKYNGKSYL